MYDDNAESGSPEDKESKSRRSIMQQPPPLLNVNSEANLLNLSREEQLIIEQMVERSDAALP